MSEPKVISTFEDALARVSVKNPALTTAETITISRLNLIKLLKVFYESGRREGVGQQDLSMKYDFLKEIFAFKKG